MNLEKVSCDIVIVGAGVIGLATAAKLKENYPEKEIILFEKYPQFGRETSSRNSEVIHSGIYYPENSFKTKWCLEGREKLYSFCEKRNIRFNKCGKYIIAVSNSEAEYLEKRSEHCKKIGVSHQKISQKDLKNKEPLIQACFSLFFPESGIIDSHELMRVLEGDFLRGQGNILYQHEVEKIERSNKNWKLKVKEPSSEIEVTTDLVINAAGLYSTQLFQQAYPHLKYEHRFCRGRYFTLSSRYRNQFSHLIYPIPERDGLGVHVTMDQEGFARLGPDVEWVEIPNYECQWDGIKEKFYQSAHRYIPQLKKEEMEPGLIGIRPKLFIDGLAYNDFLIHSEDRFISCLGMESPGLTSSLRIAEEISIVVGKTYE